MLMNDINVDDEWFDMFQQQLGTDMSEIELFMIYKTSQSRVLS